MNILTLNAGSATLKYKLFQMPEGTVLAEGSLDHPGGEGIVQAAQEAIQKCQEHGIDAVGHRVVHGGASFTQPTCVTIDILDTLHGLKDLDPLHNPTEVAMIEAGLKALPEVPAVTVFDTVFHQTLPEAAWHYALPRQLSDTLHLRRYGFHGISYQYVSGRLLGCLEREGQGTKLVICHLGSGASVCALRDGCSVDTSMGMTPLEGLVMGTRSGDIDPGLLLYLLRTQKMTVQELEDLLNHQSGLKGLSGGQSDVRQLEEAAKTGNAQAEMALDIFCYRIRKYIGAYAAVLGGLDALAFTGGIGEHSAVVRQRIIAPLAFLGVQIDPDLNQARSGQEIQISPADAPVSVWVIPTDEERQIARETYALIKHIN